MKKWKAPTNLKNPEYRLDTFTLADDIQTISLPAQMFDALNVNAGEHVAYKRDPHVIGFNGDPFKLDRTERGSQGQLMLVFIRQPATPRTE